ncbi:hypothetical protein SANTM175S_07715 [Streptomyces antimycoticus]
MASVAADSEFDPVLSGVDRKRYPISRPLGSVWGYGAEPTPSAILAGRAFRSEVRSGNRVSRIRRHASDAVSQVPTATPSIFCPVCGRVGIRDRDVQQPVALQNCFTAAGLGVDPVPFGNSSLLLRGGLAPHHGLLEPCPGDRFSGVPGGSETARGPGVAAAAGRLQGSGTVGTADENAVLRRQLSGPVRYEPADRLWFSALSSADSPAPVGAGVPGDAWDVARVASQVDLQEVGLQQVPGQARETVNGVCGEGAGGAADQGKSGLGLPSGPGRTDSARASSGLDDGLGDPDVCRH